MDFNDFDYLLESHYDETIVTERYYGKNKTLLECEELVAKLQAMCIEDYSVDLTHSLANTKLQANLTKLFNVEKVLIHWTNSAMINARTCMNLHIIQTLTNSDDIGKDGLKNKNGEDIILIYINKGVLMLDYVKPAHVIAILLHEIGHNFSNNGYRAVTALLYSIQTDIAKNITMNALSSAPAKSIRHGLRSSIAANSVLSKLSMTTTKIISVLSEGLQLLLSPAVTLTIPVAIIFGPLSQLVNVLSKKFEDYADSVATAYGYGVELSEFLQLAETKGVGVKTKFQANPFTKVLYDIGQANYEILAMLGTPHGTYQERTKKAIMKLESDIKSGDFDNNMKKELTRDLDRLKSQYNMLISTPEGERQTIATYFRSNMEKNCAGRPDIIARIFPENQI